MPEYGGNIQRGASSVRPFAMRFSEGDPPDPSREEEEEEQEVKTTTAAGRGGNPLRPRQGW
eukprot:3825437-Pyramimonas_sp.AAC.1